MKSSEGTKKATVVDFMRDASFFVERGQRLLYRYDYERALRCFRRAVEIEPNNAGYHCQLASALAEMGRFEASNDVLHHVLDNVDARMVDIYFYLANNYAHLEDYQMAEEMAVTYLQKSQHGVYADEAEELLDYIYFELDMPPRRFFEPSGEGIYQRHEAARQCLEEGRFLKALEILQDIVKTDESFMPAWNNLSLAYYYIGDFEKALQTIEQTLEREPGNLHALCNLAVLLSHLNRSAELVELLTRLKKVTPIHFEHMYKLATTLGVLGQHQEAYRLYQRMLRVAGPQDPCIYHYAAISALLTDRKEQAVRWWQKAKQLDPDAGIADYYLRLVKERPDGAAIGSIPYHYCHPEQLTPPDQTNWTCPEDFKDNPMIRASLLWALQHGKDEVKQVVLQTLTLLGDAEAEAAVRQFCKETTDPHFQKLALLALAEMGASLPYEVASSTGSEGTEDKVSAAIRQQFGQVDRQFCAWALKLWQAYRSIQEPIRIRKETAWLAAMEYLYGKLANAKLSRTELADKYGVSLPTMAKCIRALSVLI
ncbi:tetratricopeptide repeat protein [Brevibacillus sp. SYP-B805]|uniref:tetratricopeptide repeat protein n=1 Tax=Brevibacillus sp. SYP-B805 TaxID=1578199 RepID=UPI0013E9D54C|nr:tetratricopeptide repeat protein [Brevibacillus sp. SYP-B805]NGQ95072.1 tetratricopeptide repeat protein [Brevibacillus sp. SYP-B805]